MLVRLVFDWFTNLSRPAMRETLPLARIRDLRGNKAWQSVCTSSLPGYPCRLRRSNQAVGNPSPLTLHRHRALDASLNCEYAEGPASRVGQVFGFQKPLEQFQKSGGRYCSSWCQQAAQGDGRQARNGTGEEQGRSMNRYKRMAVAFIAVGGMAAGALVATAGPAFADYGPGAAYQVEVSANTNHPSTGSFWIWAELTPAAPGATHGTGDYEEADCIHLGGGHATDQAAHDSGTLGWSISGGVLTLTGVKIIAGAETATISLPTTSAPGGYGHTNGITVEVTAPNPSPPGLLPFGVPLPYPGQNEIAR